MKQKKYTVIGQDGRPCPRCGLPTEIRGHIQGDTAPLRKAYHYSKWFYCNNKHCRTNLIMDARYIVRHEDAPKEDVVKILRLLCHPMAECLSDGDRLTRFVHCGNDAIAEIVKLRKIIKIINKIQP